MKNTIDNIFSNVIQLKSDDRLRIESTAEFNKSIFKDQYKRGYRIVDEIIKNADRLREDIAGCGNIVAFLGERGSGKSSVMYSFANSLIQYADLRQQEKIHVFFDENNSERDIRFVSLGSFDASSLEAGENIFSNILSQMFAQFEKNAKNFERLNGRTEFYLREIQEDFVKVFTTFQNLNRTSGKEMIYESTALSLLKHYATSYDVRENFVKLVDKYRTLITKSRDENIYFLLQIDDMDMNIRYGFEMLEQLERYVTIPGVIIMITGSYEQLEILGERHFIEMFPRINKDMKNTQIEYARRTSREYLEKTIPIQHRIYMPAFHNALTNVSDTLIVEKENVKIKRTLLGKIGRRTNVYFDGLGLKRHFLEPNSLRGLNDYYSFLNELVKLRECPSSQQEIQREYNHERFLQDISHRFVFQYLNEEQIAIFRILCNADDREKNAYLMYCMQKSLGGKEDKYNESCSYGDLLYTLYLYARIHPENKKLGHGILIVYSFLLNRYIQKDAQPGQEEKTLARILGNSITGSWDKVIFHYMDPMQSNFEKHEKYYYGSHHNFDISNANANKGIRWHSPLNGAAIPNTVDDIISWFKKYKDFLISLEIMMFFWENLRITHGTEINYYHTCFTIKCVVEDGAPAYIDLKLDNDRGDFSILAFIMNSYNYREFFKSLHESLIEAIIQVNQLILSDADKQKIMTVLKENGLFQQYEKWESDYSCRIAVPFQHADIYYHMLKRLKTRMQTKVPGSVKKEDVLFYLRLFYEDIETQLQNEDDFYKHEKANTRELENITNFQKIYQDCPFIKTLKSWGLNEHMNTMEVSPSKEYKEIELKEQQKDLYWVYKNQLAAIFTTIADGNSGEDDGVSGDNNDF